MIQDKQIKPKHARTMSLWCTFFAHINPDNFPPIISAEVIFRVNVGEESVFSLNVVDPNLGDEFTLTVQGGLPADSVLEEIAEGEYAFRWNLMDVTTEPLVFIANDTRGASSTFIPTVEVCACVNGGSCILDVLLESDTTVVLNCHCSEGRFKNEWLRTRVA